MDGETFFLEENDIYIKFPTNMIHKNDVVVKINEKVKDSHVC